MEITLTAIATTILETNPPTIKQTTTEIKADDVATSLKLDHDAKYACLSWLNTMAIATSTMILAAVRAGLEENEEAVLAKLIDSIRAMMAQRDVNKIQFIHDGKLN